jgi:hypothetical protein
MNKGILSVLSVVLLSVGAANCGQDATSTSDDVSATASALSTVTISGTVSASTGPLAGVPVNLSGGASSSVFTDAAGKYSFPVATAKTYTVAPALAGCAFTPVSQTFMSVGLNHTANFTGAGSGCTSTGAAGSAGGGGAGSGGSGGLGTMFTTHKQYAQDTGPGNLVTTYTSFAQLTLPAGNYAVSARAFVVDADTAARASVFCTIEGGNLASTDLAPVLGTNITTNDAVQLPSGGVLHFNCESSAGRFGPNGNVWLLTADMTAVQVQNVVFQ